MAGPSQERFDELAKGLATKRLSRRQVLKSVVHAALLTTAVLLCLGAFLLAWPASGSEVSAALTMVGSPHYKQGANGHPIDGEFLALFAEGDEVRDALSKNARLLGMLVVVLIYGTALRRLLASGWTRSRPEVTSLIRCCFHSMV